MCTDNSAALGYIEKITGVAELLCLISNWLPLSEASITDNTTKDRIWGISGYCLACR